MRSNVYFRAGIALEKLNSDFCKAGISLGGHPVFSSFGLNIIQSNSFGLNIRRNVGITSQSCRMHSQDRFVEQHHIILFGSDQTFDQFPGFLKTPSPTLITTIFLIILHLDIINYRVSLHSPIRMNRRCTSVEQISAKIFTNICTSQSLVSLDICVWDFFESQSFAFHYSISG